jgi:hypothetical protein
MVCEASVKPNNEREDARDGEGGTVATRSVSSGREVERSEGMEAMMRKILTNQLFLYSAGVPVVKAKTAAVECERVKTKRSPAQTAMPGPSQDSTVPALCLLP